MKRGITGVKKRMTITTMMTGRMRKMMTTRIQKMTTLKVRNLNGRAFVLTKISPTSINSPKSTPSETQNLPPTSKP
jgi:hypothetical protein